jgi:hypothetical protein
VSACAIAAAFGLWGLAHRHESDMSKRRDRGVELDRDWCARASIEKQ